MDFSDEGGEVFARITKNLEKENQQQPYASYPDTHPQKYARMAVVLDGKLYSAPTVREEIRGGGAVITGVFTFKEAVDLANVLNNPLEVPLRSCSNV